MTPGEVSPESQTETAARLSIPMRKHSRSRAPIPMWWENGLPTPTMRQE